METTYFLFVFGIRASECGWSFDVEFFKPLVVIRPLYNKHKNVICAKKSFIEKNVINNFWF